MNRSLPMVMSLSYCHLVASLLIFFWIDTFGHGLFTSMTIMIKRPACPGRCFVEELTIKLIVETLL